MKTSSKVKNIIVSHGINGSYATDLLKQAWRSFKSLLKASPTLVKMVVETLKDIHIMDLLRRKKRCNHGINILLNSTPTVPKLDYLSQDVRLHEAATGPNDNTYFSLQPSLIMERIRDGGGASGNSGGCSVNNTASVEEVDDLADAFISRFYNNMRLERQQSYTRYQEMLARGT
jgi:hypothetical protein